MVEVQHTNMPDGAALVVTRNSTQRDRSDRNCGSMPLAAACTEKKKPEFAGWLLDNWGGDKQTTLRRKRLVRAPQIDFFGNCS